MDCLSRAIYGRGIYWSLFMGFGSECEALVLEIDILKLLNQITGIEDAERAMLEVCTVKPV